MEKNINTDFDLIIIGAGPAGYVAAIRAAQLGIKTAVVEKQHLGGVCLNWGCIPTKALLRSAEVFHLVKNAAEFGIKASSVTFDEKAIIARSRKVSEGLSAGVKSLLKKNKVATINGHASFVDNQVITVQGETQQQQYKAKNYIIATGAGPKHLTDFPVDHNFTWDYKDAMLPKKWPKKLVVVGSGAIGIEFASFYNSFGCDVTIVEAQDRILCNEDQEISALASGQFEKQGIKIITSAKLIKQSKGKLEIEAGGKKQSLPADNILYAVGINANSDNLGLENTAIKLEKGFICIDQQARTAEENIFAVGDVAASKPWLAHKASHEAIMAVEVIAGQKPKAINPLNVPSCTYAHPQIASIGLTEAAARDKYGQHIKIGKFPFMANGKALAMGEGEGLIKLIFSSKHGELLGCHMIGAEVTELIHSAALIRQLEGCVEDFAHTIFPHPTLSEMLHEAALAADGKQIHI